MRAGRLRRRVTIQQNPSPTQDTFGAEEESWSDVDTVWAAVEPLSGREFMDGKQLKAAVDTRIRIRYRSGLDSEMRVVWGSHIYDVKAVVPDERNRETHLMCEEVL